MVIFQIQLWVVRFQGSFTACVGKFLFFCFHDVQFGSCFWGIGLFVRSIRFFFLVRIFLFLFLKRGVHVEIYGGLNGILFLLFYAVGSVVGGFRVGRVFSRFGFPVCCFCREFRLDIVHRIQDSPYQLYRFAAQVSQVGDSGQEQCHKRAHLADTLVEPVTDK